jgi:hypothetical protein
MSTVAEIEAAIEQLPPEEVRALQEWIAKRTEGKAARKWSSEELTEGARRMVAESDPKRVEVLKEEIMRGFYGTAVPIAASGRTAVEYRK